MLEQIVENVLSEYKADIDAIGADLTIDCVTIFPKSEEEFRRLDGVTARLGKLIDEMASGNLYKLDDPIVTPYGRLGYVKIRVFDQDLAKYWASVDFTVDDYLKFKDVVGLDKAVVKRYDNFELLQFKNDTSLINVVSVAAEKEYDLN